MSTDWGFGHHENQPRTGEDLEEKIQHEIASFPPDMLFACRNIQEH